MEETDFDLIVVGSGCAGATAAYVAASAGKSVLVIERGEYPGAKNMTGGRIYAHSLKPLFSDIENEAPFERKITHERIALMAPEANMTIDFTGRDLGEEDAASYSVLCGRFNQWLSEKAEEAGAEYICGIAVEELLKDEAGKVRGVRAGEDEVTAHVVIVAEGANSLLAERYLGAPRPKPIEMAVGIKEVFELPAEEIESRFLCPEGEGAAMLFVGDCTHGNIGGGFLYTNKESISLGLVATIEDLQSSEDTIYQLLDDFKRHPSVAPIIRGAKVVEHSGHMVPEGGYAMVPEYVHDGALIAGDAAMMCMNLGYMVRGMDLAVASGRMAAEAACEAIDAGDTSRAGLEGYRARLEDSFVMKDMETFRRWPQTMAHWNRMFQEYPVMVEEIFTAMFKVDGTPMVPLRKRVAPIVKKHRPLKLAGEVKGALKAL